MTETNPLNHRTVWRPNDYFHSFR